MGKRNLKKNSFSVPEEIKMLAQGSYGCTYRRGVDCFGKLERPQYITKIQKHKSNSDRETNIGEKIKKIRNHSVFFAPVLKSCPLVLAGIDSDEISQCDFLRDTNFQNETYETNRIRYVGKLTYGDYLIQTFKTHPARFLITFCEFSQIVLTSLKKIAGKQIVHFDMKENNILIHDSTKQPVIIDFGLSFDVGDLKSGKLEITEAFYAYDSFEVSYWAIDIALCCYIDKLERTRGAWKDEIVTEEQIEDVIENFFKFNPVFGKESKYLTGEAPLFTSEEIKQYRTVHSNMFRTEFVGKKWKDVVESLLNYAFSWDNYSVAVMNISLLYELKLQTFPELKPILVFFKSVLLKACNERPTCDVTSREFTSLLAGINNIGTPVVNRLRNLSNDANFVSSQEDNRKISKLESAKQEDKFYEKQGAHVPILVQ